MLRPIELDRRSTRGGSVTELPVMLTVIFLLLTFPLIDLATVMLRYTYLLGMSRDAVHEAARAKTFLTDSSPEQPSAVNAVNQYVNWIGSRYQGIKVDNVRTQIVIADLDSNQTARQTTPLALPAESSDNLYSLETVISGRISPLVTISGKSWPSIPGLTSPMSVVVSSREICENTQGLNQ